MPEQTEIPVDNKSLLNELRMAIIMAKLEGKKEITFPIPLAELVESIMRPICGELDS
jgi:hypothetical protein